MKTVAVNALAVVVTMGAFVTPASAQQGAKSYNDAYVDRLTKINDRMLRRQIAADCKAEAKRTYSAVHFQKRRNFIKDCIARKSP